MEFYHQCLGGKLYFQELGNTRSRKAPPDMKKKILHAALKLEHFALMGTDIDDFCECRNSGSISIVLTCSNKREIKYCFDRLSDGGKITSALKVNNWGAMVGLLEDKFGNSWILTKPKYANTKNYIS